MAMFPSQSFRSQSASQESLRLKKQVVRSFLGRHIGLNNRRRPKVKQEKHQYCPFT